MRNVVAAKKRKSLIIKEMNILPAEVRRMWSVRRAAAIVSSVNALLRVSIRALTCS
jgi:REP element-mobilizing transposase RayT